MLPILGHLVAKLYWRIVGNAMLKIPSDEAGILQLGAMKQRLKHTCIVVEP